MNDENTRLHISRGRWVLYGFLGIAGFLLFTEHRAHVLGLLDSTSSSAQLESSSLSIS